MARKEPTERGSEDSFKETLESIVIAFILAFVFRAYVVEAFVIPTGSMAPTLLGRHVRVMCRQCGYRFATDTPKGHDKATVLQEDAVALCPMCHYPQGLRRGTSISAGDRILVQKYLYSLTDPQRWDVLVFKAPHQPETNYIKRLVGLPQERVWLIEGNVYVQPIDQGPVSWRIARKPVKVQQAVWQPIYDSGFVPLDRGRHSPGRAKHPWRQPWVPGDPGAWQLSNPQELRYKGSGTGIIRFDFRHALKGSGGPGLYSYNQLKHGALPFTPVEDVRIAASFEPVEPGLSLSIKTTARLNDPEGRVLELVGHIDSQGVVTLRVQDPQTGQGETQGQPIRIEPLPPAIATTVELWYVDQEASLWVDGKQIQVWRFDLPIQTVKARRQPSTLPKIAIEVAGSEVALHRVQVDRDFFYTAINPSGDRARGALVKGRNGHHGGPIELKNDQFFCCGDNSPLSQDSRFWTEVNPWIRKRLFQNTTNREQAIGIVPRQLIMGKAFFVYFPTPLLIAPGKPAVIPNFGDMRFIH